MDYKKSTGKIAAALAEFKFCHYCDHFMERSNYDDIPLYNTLYFVREQIGTQNRLENGRGAWVALCAHPTYTDIDTDTASEPRSPHSIHSKAECMAQNVWT
jgi:hypothetical protein